MAKAISNGDSGGGCHEWRQPPPYSKPWRRRIKQPRRPVAQLVPSATWAQEGDPGILAAMERINRDLAIRGLGYRFAQIDLCTLGWGQPSHRILMNGRRWTPYDFLRCADGDNIICLVMASRGATVSGLSSSATEAAIDRAMTTWDRQRSLQKVDIVKRGHRHRPGTRSHHGSSRRLGLAGARGLLRDPRAELPRLVADGLRDSGFVLAVLPDSLAATARQLGFPGTPRDTQLRRLCVRGDRDRTPHELGGAGGSGIAGNHALGHGRSDVDEMSSDRHAGPGGTDRE
jgi:hypothetical protein